MASMQRRHQHKQI
ncbi:hypothetical protein N7503_012176 [Penicillium pulvis]|nr:hypothetical protein N7503_012176 [Penicillium pulvis]